MANSSPLKRDRVSPGRDHLREPLGHVDQQGIADQVTKSVVDRLERIEVEEQDDQALPAVPRPGEPGLDPIGQQGRFGRPVS